MKIFRLNTGYKNKKAVVIIGTTKTNMYKGFTFLGMVFISTPKKVIKRELVKVILHELIHTKQYKEQGFIKHFKTRKLTHVRIKEELEAYIYSTREAYIFNTQTRETLEAVYESYNWTPKKPYDPEEEPNKSFHNIFSYSVELIISIIGYYETIPYWKIIEEAEMVIENLEHGVKYKPKELRKIINDLSQKAKV